MHKMIKFPFYFILACTFIAASCGSQMAKESSSTPAPPSTPEGINEASDFDGQYGKSDSTLQFNVMVTDIFQDSKGNYWFGSHGDGLCMYDGVKFNYFTVENGLPNGPVREIAPGLDWDDVRSINAGNQIAGIQEDEHGNMFFVNGMSEILMYDGQEFKIMKAEEGEVLSTNKSEAEWQADLDCLWFAKWADLGVLRYDGSKLTSHMFPHPYSLTVNGVSEIYTDNDGTMWFGTMDHGTFRYDRTSFECISKKDQMGICRVVFQDQSDRIWMGNNRFSLNYMENNTLHNFTEEQEQAAANDLNFNEDDIIGGAQSIEQDTDGNVWIGMFGGGVHKYDGKVTLYTEVGGLTIDIVKSIYKDQSGQLLFGIGEGSVYTFDGELFHRFDGMPIQPY